MTETLQDEQQRYCLGCGYRLNDLPEPRCPECDLPFEPNNSDTFTRRPLSAWERWAMRPPGWRSHLIALFILLYCMWRAAIPGISHGPNGLYVLGFPWMLFAGYLGFRVYLYSELRKGLRIRSSRRGWFVAPTIVCLLVLLVRADLPLRVGFWISRDALHERVQAVNVAGGEHLPILRTAGLYSVRSAAREPFFAADAEGVRLSLVGGDAGLLEDAGFYYTPGSPPPEVHTGLEGTYYRHMSGNWYAWYRIME